MNNTSILEVAVGVILQNDNVLLAWRDAALHQGGRYEFSGGKIENGETPVQALTRELWEELTIQVSDHRPFLTLTYCYPEKTVRLYVFLVTRFSGIPTGQTGQALTWVNRHDLWHYPLPSANVAIVRALQLPSIYRISPSLASNTALLQALELLNLTNLPKSSLWYCRQPHLSVKTQFLIVEWLHQHRTDVKVMLRQSVFKAFIAEDLGDDTFWATLNYGIHLTHDDLFTTEKINRDRPERCYIAACHDIATIERANALGVDALTISPVLPTASHSDVLPLGWQQFAALAQHSNVPVYALGGLIPQHVDLAQSFGAYGVAGIQAFL